MTDDAQVELDRIEGAPHPRDTALLRGQGAAQAAFLAAYNSGRLHHAWLITGPRGVGKATLAWRIARFLLVQPHGAEPDLRAAPSLDVSAGHPVVQRVAASSEGRLKLIRRGWDDEDKKLDTQITVKRIRALKSFLQLSAPDGGRRIVIIDSADEMGPQAANALLKVLEEPPGGCVMLLVCHRPSALLPTIRSRCRELRCVTLTPDDLAAAVVAAGGTVADGGMDAAALAELADGSVGAAIRLLNLDGLGLYRGIAGLFATGTLDRPRALALAQRAVGRAAEPRYDLLLTLVETFLARIARTAATGHPPPAAAPGEAAMLRRLAGVPRTAPVWADLQQTLGARARAGKAVNLDPAALLLDMMLKIDETAAPLAAR